MPLCAEAERQGGLEYRMPGDRAKVAFLGRTLLYNLAFLYNLPFFIIWILPELEDFKMG